MTTTAQIPDHRPGVGPHTMRRRLDESAEAFQWRVDEAKAWLGVAKFREQPHDCSMGRPRCVLVALTEAARHLRGESPPW